MRPGGFVPETHQLAVHAASLLPALPCQIEALLPALQRPSECTPVHCDAPDHTVIASSWSPSCVLCLYGAVMYSALCIRPPSPFPRRYTARTSPSRQRVGAPRPLQLPDAGGPRVGPAPPVPPGPLLVRGVCDAWRSKWRGPFRRGEAGNTRVHGTERGDVDRDLPHEPPLNPPPDRTLLSNTGLSTTGTFFG